eukprot:11088887-Lingulodinium_polyedra.AAC.1
MRTALGGDCARPRVCQARARESAGTVRPGPAQIQTQVGPPPGHAQLGNMRKAHRVGRNTSAGEASQ